MSPKYLSCHVTKALGRRAFTFLSCAKKTQISGTGKVARFPIKSVENIRHILVSSSNSNITTPEKNKIATRLQRKECKIAKLAFLNVCHRAIKADNSVPQRNGDKNSSPRANEGINLENHEVVASNGPENPHERPKTMPHSNPRTSL